MVHKAKLINMRFVFVSVPSGAGNTLHIGIVSAQLSALVFLKTRPQEPRVGGAGEGPPTRCQITRADRAAGQPEGQPSWALTGGCKPLSLLFK